jgi:hypothetical protein
LKLLESNLNTNQTYTKTKKGEYGNINEKYDIND